MNIRPSSACTGGVEIKTDNCRITICTGIKPVAGQPLTVGTSGPWNLNETLINDVLNVWKESFPDAAVLVPAAAATTSPSRVPSSSVTLTHTMKGSTTFSCDSNNTNRSQWNRLDQPAGEQRLVFFRVFATGCVGKLLRDYVA